MDSVDYLIAQVERLRKERNASMDEATALRAQVKELERENEALRWGISQMTPENRQVFYAK